MRKRLTSIFLALLVVSSGAAAPVSAASMTDSQCDTLTGFIKNTVMLGLTGTPSPECSDSTDAIEEMKESDANQTKSDIYSAASSQIAHKESFTATFDNYLNDTDSVAWMKVQIAVSEAYQNGSTQEEARVEARNAIDEYYSKKQVNLLQNWETNVNSIMAARERAEMEDGVSADTVQFDWVEELSSNYDAEFSVRNVTVTLANGTQYQTVALQITTYDVNGSYPGRGWTNPDTGFQYDTTSQDEHYARIVEVIANGPDGLSQSWFTPADWVDRYDRIDTARADLKAESDNFVNATYSDYDSGAINASDVISANTAMFEYGTEHNENSSLYDSTAALAMMGFDTPDMSSSGTMDVTYNGNTYTGIVLARNAPGGSWQSGTTYNTSNITGPVFLATTGGEKVDFAEGETFTIDQMRSKSGQNVTQVNTTEYVYKTANTSQQQELIQKMTDLREEIESREPDGGGAGGFGANSKTVIAVAALAGAALLLGRGGN